MAIVGVPYSGFYNGNPRMMIANGTFDDFRSIIEHRIELGKLSQEKFDQYVAEWDAIPLEEKQRRRSFVVEESTPRPVEVQTPQGKVIVYRAKPSDNDNANPSKRLGRPKGKKNLKVPVGALTEENNPLVAPVIPSPV